MRDGSSLGRGKRVIQLVAPRDTQAAQILTASGHLEDRLQEAGLRSVRPHELRLVRGVGWVLKHTKLLVNLIDSRNTAYFAQVAAFAVSGVPAAGTTGTVTAPVAQPLADITRSA